MNSFSIPGPHLHGHHGRQSAKATGLPRQSLSSHLSPLARWRWGNKNRKNKERRGEKNENFTHKSEKWTLGGIYARTRAHSTSVGPGNCLPEQSQWATGGRWRRCRSSMEEGDSLPTRPSHSVSGLRPPSGIRRFFNAKPNWNRTEPNRSDAKRNEMQPKRTCFSIKNVEKSTKNSFELPTVDRHTRTRTDTHTHTYAYWETGRVQRQVINGTSRGILDAQKSQLCEFNEFRSLNALFNCLRYGKRMENI